MDELPTLLGTPREWAKDMTTATVIGLFLGVIGPFGSFGGGPLELRLFYWVANMWIGFAILSLTVRAALRVAVRVDLPVWFALGIGVALGCLPLGLLLALFSAWFWPANHGHMAGFQVWYGESLALAEPFSFGFYFLRRQGLHDILARDHAVPCQPTETPPEAAPLPPPTADPKTGATFLDRLPPHLGRELLCLQMEDHYVRAHTARGSDLILIPLKQAMAELEGAAGIEGMQVHRSWWVARAAQPEPVTNGRNLALRLTSGLEVPVSRPSVAKLRAAAWIAAK